MISRYEGNMKKKEQLLEEWIEEIREDIIELQFTPHDWYDRLEFLKLALEDLKDKSSH